MSYTDQDYLDAINFVLNYPPDFRFLKYDMYKDLFKVDVFDGGWYCNLKLQGSLIRSALKYKGVKKVCRITLPTTKYIT